jgi:DNA-binding PadR family transcriptional regulator
MKNLVFATFSIITGLNQESFTLGDIEETLSEHNMDLQYNRGAKFRVLRKLVKAGILTKVGRKTYRMSDEIRKKFNNKENINPPEIKPLP